MFLITHGRLRQEKSSDKVDKKMYSFYPLKHSGKVSMSLRQRFLPDTVVFGSYAADQDNLAAGILNSLLKCDLDTRKSLIGKIVVSGGVSMIPGFIERLEEEILELLGQPEYIKLAPLKSYVNIKESIIPRNICNWVGGSLVSTLPGVDKFAIQAERYREKGLSDLFGAYYLYANRPAMSEFCKPNIPEKKRLSILNT